MLCLVVGLLTGMFFGPSEHAVATDLEERQRLLVVEEVPVSRRFVLVIADWNLKALWGPLSHVALHRTVLDGV